MLTGIVVALPQELDTLTDLPGFKKNRKIAKGTFKKISDQILVAHSGSGPKFAQLAAEQLVSNGAERLISWGCAAALSKALKAGDLILADELIDEKGNCLSVKSEWAINAANQLLQDLPVYTGRMAESVDIVSLSKDKKKLHLKTGAIALDMESLAVAKVAMLNKLPFMTLRAIADTVDLDLPMAISNSLNDQGDVELGSLLRYLALHPGQLPGLIKTGICFSAAKKSLTRVAKQLTDLN